jgi:DNA-binding MarR family transcriptional regulator
MATTSGSGHESLDVVFDDLVRCETRLYNALSETLRAARDVPLAQFEFLRFLHQNPRSRVADLAARFAVGVGATSKGVDRLAAAGLVQRIPNPDDRRSSLLELTQVGAEQVEQAEAAHQEKLRSLIEATIGPEAFLAMAPALHALRKDLESAGIGTPAG